MSIVWNRADKQVSAIWYHVSCLPFPSAYQIMAAEKTTPAAYIVLGASKSPDQQCQSGLLMSSVEIFLDKLWLLI